MQFRLCVILEAALKNFQNLRRRLPGGAHDEDAIEAPLVFPIRIRQSSPSQPPRRPACSRCSCSDQATDCVDEWVQTPATLRFADDSGTLPSNPIAPELRHTSFAAASSAASSASGLRATIPSAHALDPQQGRICAHGLVDRKQIPSRQNILVSSRGFPLTVRIQPMQETQPPDCQPPLRDIWRSIEYHRSDESQPSLILLA